MVKLKRIIIVFRVIAIIILAIALLLGSIIIYNSVYDYNPKEKEKLSITGKSYQYIAKDSMVTILNWNIGYCGLGKDMDFFYDGGKKVRPSKNDFQKYLNGVLNFLARNDTVDIILIQEIDSNAKRSYYINEVELLDEFLPYYNKVFAKNYDVRFVPVPWYSPMGSVISGMMTLSKKKPVEAYRYPYYASYSWPKNLFLLDRCLIYTRYRMPGDKDLIVINTHNSAFDDAVALREEEGYILKAIILDEYERGNYVVVGGDWNRNPPGFDMRKLSSSEAKKTAKPGLDNDFLPDGWKWVYDPEIPTNRENVTAYMKGKTKTTIIDYFAVSPNLDVVENKTIQCNFENSDHQPVFIRVKIKADTAIKAEEAPANGKIVN